jgi:hypothetical protein
MPVPRPGGELDLGDADGLYPAGIPGLGARHLDEGRRLAPIVMDLLPSSWRRTKSSFGPSVRRPAPAASAQRASVQDGPRSIDLKGGRGNLRTFPFVAPQAAAAGV